MSDLFEIRSEQDLVSDCVHCGFCLPTCPTYRLWGEEADSPRGRILLMAARLDGTVELTDTVVERFDRCLGCMACLTACPSGVQYDALIELTREHVEQEHRRPLMDRLLRTLIFQTFPNPRRLRVALALAPLGRVLPAPRAFRPLVALAPSFRSRDAPPALTAPVGARVARVGLLLGCVQREIFGDVNTATARVLAADGFEVVSPATQGCCGALAIHAGRRDDGRDRARTLIDEFERADVEYVITNAAGCGSSVKEYGRLLADDPAWAERAARFSSKVRDISELLAERGPQAERHPLELSVAFQDSCHLLHAQGVQSAPRAVLSAIPGLDLREPADQEICCGSAGIYNLVQPEAAAELGRAKAHAVLATGATAYASANPGCLIQLTTHLRALGSPLPAFHPVELADASIRGIDAATLVAGART
jgi:glycolate oxidase iron-sulfur subunit